MAKYNCIRKVKACQATRKIKPQQWRLLSRKPARSARMMASFVRTAKSKSSLTFCFVTGHLRHCFQRPKQTYWQPCGTKRN